MTPTRSIQRTTRLPGVLFESIAFAFSKRLLSSGLLFEWKTSA